MRAFSYAENIKLGHDPEADIQEKVEKMYEQAARTGDIKHVAHSVSFHYHGMQAMISVAGFFG